jgi:hypothetical protein
MAKSISQKAEIQAWLERGHRITPMQALDKWGCFRLAARVAELREDGLEIDTSYQHKNGKVFASYGLARG